MIQLPTLSAPTAENPVKSASSAAPQGVFATILDGETGAARPAGGKILPKGGKNLPDALPPEAIAHEAARKGLPHAHGKAAAKPQVEAEIAGSVPTAATDDEEADTAPQGTDVLEAIALAVEVPLMLDTAVPVQQLPVTAQPEAGAAKDAPASAAGNPVPMLALTAPGTPPTSESGAQMPDARPAPETPLHAARALLAALRQPADTKNKPATEQTAAPRQAIAAAEAAPATALPATALDGERPAKAPRPQSRHEVTLELTKDAKPSAAERAAPRSALSSVLAMTPAGQPVVSDAAAPAQAARLGLDTANAQHSVRPHEFAALVDRLVEAREAVRPASANLTLMHADFGQVSLRFGHDNGNLTVALANSDPGFLPAVNAAVAADGSGNGDAAFQGGRREDGGQPAASRGTGDAGTATGERGSGRESNGRHAHGDGIKPQPHFASRGDRNSRGGIFA